WPWGRVLVEAPVVAGSCPLRNAGAVFPLRGAGAEGPARSGASAASSPFTSVLTGNTPAGGGRQGGGPPPSVCGHKEKRRAGRAGRGVFVGRGRWDHPSSSSSS